MEFQAERQFTPLCPLCGHGRGRPHTVMMQHEERTITHEERTITYVCGTCDQAWTATDHGQQPSLGESRPGSSRSSVMVHCLPLLGLCPPEVFQWLACLQECA